MYDQNFVMIIYIAFTGTELEISEEDVLQETKEAVLAESLNNLNGGIEESEVSYPTTSRVARLIHLIVGESGYARIYTNLFIPQFFFLDPDIIISSTIYQ